MYRTILLAYDGSNYSDVALRQGADLARACGAQLHLLGVVQTTGSMAIAEGMGGQDIWGRERAHVEKALEAAKQAATEQGVTAIVTISEGDPAGEILRHARAVKADLVVLGHKERGVVASWFGRSVGADLLGSLPCSVLIATG
jgi:nucleotide-binding universal stress UspA family protein